MINVYITRTQEQELNHYVSEHLEKCYEWSYDIEMGIEPTEFEPFAPFCACDTCVQRETLHAAFDWLEKQGILKLESDERRQN